MQDLPEILTDCLQRQYCPVGGLINLVNLWHSAYQQSSTTGGSAVVIVSSSSCCFLCQLVRAVSTTLFISLTATGTFQEASSVPCLAGVLWGGPEDTKKAPAIQHL